MVLRTLRLWVTRYLEWLSSYIVPPPDEHPALEPQMTKEIIVSYTAVTDSNSNTTMISTKVIPVVNGMRGTPIVSTAVPIFTQNVIQDVENFAASAAAFLGAERFLIEHDANFIA